MDERAPARDGSQYLETLDRILDEGVVQEGRISVHEPLLDLELLSIDFETFVASCETYLDLANALNEAEPLPSDTPPVAGAGNEVESDSSLLLR